MVNNSSVSIITVAGLASGSHYQVHVESLSVSGVAKSKSKLFETQREIGHQQTSLIIFAVLFVSVSSVAVIVLVIKSRSLRRYVVISYFAHVICASD